MACAKNYRPLNGLGQHHRVAWANCLVLAFLERIEFWFVPAGKSSICRCIRKECDASRSSAAARGLLIKLGRRNWLLGSWMNISGRVRQPRRLRQAPRIFRNQ